MRHARWRTALVGLGSNLGDRTGRIADAVRLLGEAGGVRIGRLSPLYRTSPVGKRDQPWFYNAVVMIRTRLSAPDLLRRLKWAERSLGRVRRARWGPREIDLDLLLSGQEVSRGRGMRVPHPRMHERKFVLVPASRVAGGMRVPGKASTISGLLRALRSSERVTPVSAPGQRRFRALVRGRS